MSFRVVSLIVVLNAVLVAGASAKSIRAYHIGNSLTDNIYYGGISGIAPQKSDSYTYGKHVSPGVPLDFTWNYQSKTGQMYSVPPYGLYKDALKNHTWDVVTLQPFDNQMAGADGDLQISKNFIDYLDNKSPNAQTYIYSRWPRRQKDSSGKYKPFDYSATWNTPYTGSAHRWDLSAERKGYFETLVDEINDDLPDLNKPVRLVPVGDVLAELDKRIKAKKIKHITDITQIYRDDIHLNETGGYVLGLTFFATMYRESPLHTSVPGSYGKMDPALALQLQDVVWDIVRVHPYAGVDRPPMAPLPATVPEPAAALIWLVLPLLSRRRRR